MRYLPLLSLIAVLAVSGPTLAQTVEELVITGHGHGDRPVSASQRVSYADLNLTQAGDRTVLKRRIVSAAKSVCREVGEEAPLRGNLGRSCQDTSIREAMIQVRVAFADAEAYQAFAANDLAPFDAGAMGSNVSATVADPVTNGPIPDTVANRARYGGPASTAGQRSRPKGN
jgi:UrcA family protein